jgi:heme-degrading monooxygenase HmoA
MIARIGEHSHLPEQVDPGYAAGIRAFLAARPGFCGGYHLLEPQTGHALSVTLWQDEDALAAAERAMSARTGPADGRISRQTNPKVRIAKVAAVF